MASKSPQLLIFALLSFTAFVLKASADSPDHIPVVIRYKPIPDPNIPYVAAIAKFAVSEFNKRIDSTQGLIYVKVLKGMYAPLQVDYIQYLLTIQTWTKENGLHSGQYEAIVTEKLPKHLMKLVSFKKV